MARPGAPLSALVVFGALLSFAQDSFAASCAPNTSTLCFQLGRFSATLTAQDPRTGKTGGGQAIPQNDLFGYFSIPALTNDPSNPEVFVKVLDGRTVNGRFWVFYGGLTDLQYTLTVRDTKAYSKRQMTWFRRDPAVRWYDPTVEDPLEAVA